MCARAQSEYKLTFRTDYWMSNDWRNTRYIIDELKGMLEASTANMDFSSPYLLYISTIRRLLAQLCIQVGCHSIVEWSLAKHGKLVNIKELINPVRLWHKVYMGDYIVKVKDSADDETSTKLYGVILKMPRQKSRDIRELSNITEREQALIYELLIWAKVSHHRIASLWGYIEVKELDTTLLPGWPQATVRWRLHILEGVQYLHSQGIIHGDLHGGNVLVTDDLHSVVLTDFGLSLVVGQFNNSLSARGGRQPFKAPELLNPIRFGLRESYRATEECDIYSFALVCIELYTLDDPFQPLYPNGQMPREIEFATLVIDKKLRPPKPRHHASHALVMGNGIWKLVTKCWETNPDKRLTIKELLESPGIWEF
ncbi:kinase-like domain-containing protein [Abortiporus biennis]|nr:kinase-like domain-containing protein [Abortiporus biennis]